MLNTTDTTTANTDDWPAVGNIVDGKTTFSADSMGAIIANLITRTDTLNKQLNQTSPVRGFAIHDIGFAAECKEGDIVAVDKGSGFYIPAVAKSSGNHKDDGTEIPADSATVAGVLISKDDDNASGIVLCYGVISDPDIVSKMLGGDKNAGAGDYYLSATEPGKAVKGDYAPSQMHSFCFTCLYSADKGKTPVILFRPQPPAYNGSPEVRKVIAAEDASILSVSTNKGVVTVGLNTKITPDDTKSGRALVGFGNGGIYSESVVNAVAGGVGVTVVNDDGTFVISADSGLKRLYDLNLCSLNGVYIGTSSNNGIVYTFPANVMSSLTGTIRAPYIGDNVPQHGEIQVMIEGNGASSGLSSMHVTVQDVAGAGAVAKAIPVDYTITNIETDDSDKLHVLTVRLAETQTISSNAIISVKLCATAPSVATKVVSVALKLRGGNQ